MVCRELLLGRREGISLSEQVHIYSVDTSAFYHKDERLISSLIDDKWKPIWEIDKEIKALDRQISKLKKLSADSEEQIQKLSGKIDDLKSEKSAFKREISLLKSDLKQLLGKNKGQLRVLDNSCLSIKNAISIFSSTLTRTIQMPISNIITEENLSDELIVVRVYYFDVFNDLVKHGFIYNGEKYVFFTASAGQIRTKKNVFIKESTLNRYHDTLFCGLSLEKINEMGGVNPNKYLAYLALCNSATDRWDKFDIQKCIVVNDVETLVTGEVDYIHAKSWEIERRVMDIPIEHTDGCGMVLPQLSKKNFMIRLPWMKGLLVSFPFDKWIEQHGGCSKIKDIYGREYDIFKDDIQVIFTKSQFKMWRYYKNWQQYQSHFLEFGCEAGICNVEEDFVNDACLSYQMLQTLSDLTDDELNYIAKRTNYSIKNISSDRRTMLKAFGVKKSNTNKNYFQKSLELYPEMVSDSYTRNTLSEIKKKYVKEGRAGRLRVNGKYTFLSPDWYAMCERLFLGVKNPVGLLDDGEVFCSLFKNNDRLDCLRSPHLYKEHAVKENIYKDKPHLSEWFSTSAIYTSCHDLISKMLQFDNDGDKALVVSDEVVISAATRNMKGVVPLYYEMHKAKDGIVDNQRLYGGMISAYTGGNIGEISNCISKIENSDDPDWDLVKCLCRVNNEVIDFSKTLYKTPPTPELEQKIKSYNNQKLPHFFVHAKNKSESQVCEINSSPVNRLNYIIQNPRFDFDETNTGKFNYRNLIRDQSIVFNSANKLHTSIINFYRSKINENRCLFNDADGENGNYAYVYQLIRNSMIDEFGEVGFIVDVLVDYFFGKVKSKRKNVIWGAFGDVIYENIKQNIDSDTFSCANCGERIKKIGGAKRNAQKYCSECSSDIQYYKPIRTKVLICVDCGRKVVVDSLNTKAKRCAKCQKTYRNIYQKNLMRERRIC